MHSSRMRTVRNSSRLPVPGGRGVCSGGGCLVRGGRWCLLQEGACSGDVCSGGCLLPGGCAWSRGGGRGAVCCRGMSDLGGAWSGGSAAGGCLLCGGGVVSQHALRQIPPVNRMTDSSIRNRSGIITQHGVSNAKPAIVDLIL